MLGKSDFSESAWGELARVARAGELHIEAISLLSLEELRSAGLIEPTDRLSLRWRLTDLGHKVTCQIFSVARL